jgi:hypothetical protein
VSCALQGVSRFGAGLVMCARAEHRNFYRPRGPNPRQRRSDLLLYPTLPAFSGSRAHAAVPTRQAAPRSHRIPLEVSALPDYGADLELPGIPAFVSHTPGGALTGGSGSQGSVVPDAPRHEKRGAPDRAMPFLRRVLLTASSAWRGRRLVSRAPDVAAWAASGIREGCGCGSAREQRGGCDDSSDPLLHRVSPPRSNLGLDLFG